MKIPNKYFTAAKHSIVIFALALIIMLIWKLDVDEPSVDTFETEKKQIIKSTSIFSTSSDVKSPVKAIISEKLTGQEKSNDFSGSIHTEWLSYAEFLNSVSEGEKRLIDSFNHAYAGALEFTSPDQWDWKVAHGYPTPEQILASEVLSDEELLVAAANGDLLSAIMMVDRMLDMVSELRLLAEESGLTKDEWAKIANADNRRMFMKTKGLEEQIFASGTPYAGYIAFRKGLLFGYPFGAVAGLWYAGQQGDPFGKITLENSPEMQNALGLKVPLSTVFAILSATNYVYPEKDESFRTMDFIPVGKVPD